LLNFQKNNFRTFRFHNLIKLLLISSLFIIKVSAEAAVDEDYDDGYAEDLPKKVEAANNPIQTAESAINHKSTFSYKKPSFYLPVGIVGAVLLNALVIATIVMMKKRRERMVQYARMKMDTEAIIDERNETI
jgi:hypothetical protein